MMANLNAQSMFSVFTQNGIEINSIALMGIQNSLEKFKNTNQELQNFSLIIMNEGEGDVFKISFLAKLKPEKRGLGGANRLGHGVTYLVSKQNGAILGEHGHK
jgi:hypothetical protein